MTKRTYQYRKWLRDLKEENKYWESLQVDLSGYNGIIPHIEAMRKSGKLAAANYDLTFGKIEKMENEYDPRKFPMDEIEMFGNTIPDVDGESFMGLIPYMEAKKNGTPVSEFQHKCFRYGSGLEKQTTEWVKNILMYNTPNP